MLNRKTPSLLNTQSSAAQDAPLISMDRILAVLLDEWKTILASVVLLNLLAVAYLLTATPKYSATASLLIDPKLGTVLSSQDSTNAIALDTALVDSQVAILNSNRTAESVVRNLNLDHDEEFMNPPAGPLGSVVGAIRGVMKSLKQQILGEASDEEPDTPERRAVKLLSESLTVKRVGLSYVIDVSYTSENPKRAAELANAVGNSFIVGELAAQYDSTKQVRDWLNVRLTELRDQTMAAERTVQDYKSKNNFVDTGRGPAVQQQLADLNAQISAARAATAEAKARLDRIRAADLTSPNGVTVSDALTNPVITRLRAQYLDLLVRAGDLIRRYGEKHGAVIRYEQQMAEIRKGIADEVGRIEASYLSDYQIAQARESSLDESFKQLIAQSDVNNQGLAKLRELESNADTYRTLYNNFLQKYQESAQRQSFPISNARIIAPAVEPLEKSSPKSFLILALGTLGGLMAGLGIAIGRELLSHTYFRTADDVENALEVPCVGLLPLIEPDKNGEPSAFDLSSGAYILNVPLSRYAETIRHLKISLDEYSMTRANTKVVGITSIAPRDGKSTLAVNFAQLLARSGSRTLLIDMDFRVGSTSKHVAPDARTSILDILFDGADLEQTVVVDERSGLSIIPCLVPDQRLLNSAEIVSSKMVQKLFTVARSKFDHVIVDLPPLAPVADARAAASQLDATVLVVNWMKTSRGGAQRVLASNEAIRERLIGVVINRVPFSQLPTGAHYDDYYHE